MTKAPGKARKSEASASQNVAYEDCIVSFTDVLGFRHLLKIARRLTSWTC